jgi:hypothetical protein
MLGTCSCGISNFVERHHSSNIWDFKAFGQARSRIFPGRHTRCGRAARAVESVQHPDWIHKQPRSTRLIPKFAPAAGTIYRRAHWPFSATCNFEARLGDFVRKQSRSSRLTNKGTTLMGIAVNAEIIESHRSSSKSYISSR